MRKMNEKLDLKKKKNSMLRANVTGCYSCARDLVGKKAKGIQILLWISVMGYICLSSDYVYKIVLGSLEREPHGMKISVWQA